MVSTYATFEARPEAVDPEKITPLLDEKSLPLEGRLQSYNEKDAGNASFLAKLRRGFWLAILEVTLLGFGFFAIFRNDGVYDSVQAWLANPVLIPEEPIQAFGYSFQVKRDGQDSTLQVPNTTQRKHALVRHGELWLTSYSRALHLHAPSSWVHQASWMAQGPDATDGGRSRGSRDGFLRHCKGQSLAGWQYGILVVERGSAILDEWSRCP